MVTTRKESFKLKLTLMELRVFQREVDTEETYVNRNSQTEQCTDGRFDEQISRDVTAESQNNSAVIDPRADGNRRDATVIMNPDVRRHAETQQTVNIQPFAGGSQDDIINFVAYYRSIKKVISLRNISKVFFTFF